MKFKGKKKAQSGAFMNGKSPAITEDEEIASMQKRIQEETPESGTQQKSNGLKFRDLPISQKTIDGLNEGNLTIATDIQAACIPHALAGRDILGAAKTGSGKTLAFVIPLIERLYAEKWSTDDGLAAIIITPTRELAMQIFDVIRIVGKRHQLSAGLVTGGKKEFEGEQERVVNMNILVATPGRLLQHLEQTPGFDASQLLMLVLDEADRILDMGFKTQLDSILEFLPPRQTQLFSATQTKSVKDLVRLSLKSPEYLSVHEHEEKATPDQLVQNYIVCKLQDKLDVLYGFVKSHLNSKIIVFFSTCSQVRFVHECFRGMQPGIPLTALHGKIKQERRTIIYMDYSRRKAACMFATDIAARGLDFPNVDWVVQVDAPEDSAMYIHRVGRTARYNSGGRALLMLLPHEESHTNKQLEEKSIPIKKLTVNPKHKISVSSHAAALLVAEPECRQLAKKAFTGYLRSLLLLPNRDPLDLTTLPTDEFATSYGLAFTPPLPVVASTGASGRDAVRGEKNVNRALDKLKKQIKEAKEAKRAAREEVEKKRRETTDKGTHHTDTTEEDDDEGDSEDADLFTVKKIHKPADDDEDDGDESDGIQINTSNVKKNPKLKIKPNIDGGVKVMREAGAKKIIFDDDGEAKEPMQLKRGRDDAADDGAGAGDRTADIDSYTRKVKARIDEGRAEDQRRDAERIRERHKLMRLRDKGDRPDEEDVGEGMAVLGEYEEDSTAGSDDDDGDGDSNVSDDDDDDDDDDESSVEMDAKAKEAKLASIFNKMSQSRRANQDSSDDSDDDDNSDDDSDDVDIEDQEALALRMLE